MEMGMKITWEQQTDMSVLKGVVRDEPSCRQAMNIIECLSLHLSYHLTHLMNIVSYHRIPYGRKFWREDILIFKICHLAEFTLAVEPGSAIMIFIAKWLIERAGNLTGL